MTKKSTIPLLTILVMTLSALCEEPAAPPDPQIAPLPMNISFTKTFKYKKDPPNPNATDEEKALQQFLSQFPEVEKLEVVKTGQIRKEIENLSTGISRERWKAGDVSFVVNSSTPNRISVKAPGMSFHSDVDESADFGELAWVNSKAFIREEVLQGAKCFVYRAGDQVAWIEQTSRLPVRFLSSKMEVAYTYGPPPAQTLQLPEKYVKKFEAVKRAWRGAAPVTQQ